MIKLILFASGSGSNVENIINYFAKVNTVEITKVLCNNKKAKVFERCKKLQKPCVYFTKEDFYNSEVVLDLLKQEADYIILAGFLWKVPESIIKNFPNKIINIHPALLPNYGGKGMYGIHVHRAVKANNETETGITIHYVNENYDEGAIIFQAKTKITLEDTAEDIAAKIHELEHLHFPKVIKEIILKPHE